MVGKAVIAATLTTICVFVPIVFVEGVAGQLFRDQALTVTYSLVASLIVALMLIPMLSSLAMSRLAQGEQDPEGMLVRAPARMVRAVKMVLDRLGRLLGLLLRPLYWGFDTAYGFLAAAYPKALDWSLRHRAWVLVVFIIFSGLVLQRGLSLGVELIPEMSQGEFLVDLEWPAGTPLENNAQRTAAIDGPIQSLDSVIAVFSLIGSLGQSGGYAGERKENIAQIYVRLEDGSTRRDEEEAMERVRRGLSNIPDLEYEFSRPSYFSFRTPVEVEISGYNLQTLRLLAEEVKGQMRQVPGLVDVKASTEEGQPEIQVVFDRQRVAELGTTIQSSGEILRNKLQGVVATELTRGDRRIDIRVRADESERHDLEDLQRLIVSPPAHPVPVALDAVAAVEVVEGPAEIRRVDQERVAVISANLSGRDLGSVVQEIESSMAAVPVPEGFAVAIGGQNEEMVRSFDSMKFALGLAVFLVYLVMASQFESLLHPLVIMFTIPLGLVGSALGLVLTGQSISVVVLIGLIMLAGIVVNNAIVLVDYINHLRRNEGMAKVEAVLRAGTVRLRPILMTTSTTVLGLLPMALGLGEGAEIRAPMAITVIGGLLVSTILTLVVIPVVYATLDRSS